MKELGKDMVRNRVKGLGFGQKSSNNPRLNVEIISVGKGFREVDRRRLSYLVRPSFEVKTPLTNHIRLTGSSIYLPLTQ